MPAVNVLTSKGWAVQLIHIHKEENHGQDHGFILVKDEAGTVLVNCVDFQHNRQDYYMRGWEKQLADVLSSVPDNTKGAVGESGLSEASTDTTDPGTDA
jgi:hypothetical protein